MRIVLLTRTQRPSGALVAKALIEGNKDVVAIVAEQRLKLLGKRNKLTLLIDSLRYHGLSFTFNRIIELLNIKLHYFLRAAKIYQGKKYLSIEELILNYKIPFFVVEDHNSKKSQELISNFSPDLIIITNTRIIRKNILDIPKCGCLNMHSSLLPKYAGLDSIFWALYHKEKEIGVTVHFVNEKLDEGDILLQRKLYVWPADNERTLYKKVLDVGSALVVEAVSKIEQGIANPRKQDLRLTSKFAWPTKAQRRQLKRILKQSRQESDNIKVLHLITRLVKGGAQENTLLTVLGLRDKGYQVMLASGPTYGPEGEMESEARRAGVELIIIPSLLREVNLWKDVLSFIKIYRLIKKYRFDIVHTHTSKAGILGRIAARLAGVRVVVHTPHGHIFHSYFGRLKTKVFLILEMISVRFCDKIITLTDNCQREHLELGIGNKEKFVTIPSGISLERFTDRSFDKSRIMASLGIPLDKRIVGTVARFEPVKGLEFFIEAMVEVQKEFSDTHFLIVGDGSLRQKLEQKVNALGLEDCVTFTGVRRDVVELISIMDLFVLSSLNEGMGRVIVEAGLLNKPVVATRVGGIPDLVKSELSGILVNPKDPKSLAAGIMEMLKNPDKAKAMAEAAKNLMQDNYSAELMVDRIDNLYKELLMIKKRG